MFINGAGVNIKFRQKRDCCFRQKSGFCSKKISLILYTYIKDIGGKRQIRSSKRQSPELLSKKMWQSRKSCDIISMLSYLHLATGGGVGMEVIITFLVAVAADVACHYIIKWLDGDHKDNK